MRCLVLCVCLLLAACARPLSTNEAAFATAMAGDQIDLSRVRFHNGHLAGQITVQRPVRPRVTCQERLYPPSTGGTVTVSPAAMVLFNRVLFRKDLFRADYLPGYPDKIDLAEAMLIAHEVTHIWQWQNRDRTGYHPLKALREHGNSADPYLFDPDTEADFLSFGYEQQGAIVEEYLCCHLLDRDAPRTARLGEMITAELPMDRLLAVLDRPLIRVPWSEADLDGICR